MGSPKSSQTVFPTLQKMEHSTAQRAKKSIRIIALALKNIAVF